MCNYDKAWIGKCKNEPVSGSMYCEEHTGLICVCCGSPATHECSETMGLVCGAQLCDNCEHKITEKGVNSTNCGKAGHCKKDEQEFYNWLEKDEMTKAEEQLMHRGVTIQPGTTYEVRVFEDCTHAPHLPGIYKVTANKNKLLMLGDKISSLTV